MKKQLLVTVDRGETRVALLEATGTPGASKRRGGGGSDPGRGYRVAELYLQRRGARSLSSATSTRASSIQRPGRPRGGVRRHWAPPTRTASCTSTKSSSPASRRRAAGVAVRTSRTSPSCSSRPGRRSSSRSSKDPLKTQVWLSMELTIAGRYMVYTPSGEGVGVSRRLEDAEREKASPRDDRA